MTNDILPVLANAPDSQLDSSMTKKIRDFLEKPYTDDECTDLIRDVLDLSVRLGLASEFTIHTLELLLRDKPESDEHKEQRREKLKLEYG